MKIRRKAVPATEESTPKPITGEEATNFVYQVVEEAIRPLLKRIEAFAHKGLIPIVMFELTEEAQQSVEQLFQGLPPGTDLIAMTREEFARSWARCDHVIEAWAARSRPEGDIPVFLLVHAGTLLVNVVDGDFSLEPGSGDADLDAERFS